MKNNEQQVITENSKAIRLALVFRKTDRIVKAKENRFFRKYEITSMQYCVMEVLYHRGAMTVQQLIDAVYATPGNMTAVIHNMERDGFITRETNPKDRRSFRITLTDKGEELITSVLGEHIRLIGEEFSIYSDEEKEVLIRFLEKIVGENEESEEK